VLRPLSQQRLALVVLVVLVPPLSVVMVLPVVV
jgi:hypothetical protein